MITQTEQQPPTDEVGECTSCGEEMPEHECPASRRPCGHHCNHSWSHDKCCWCGQEFTEEIDSAVATDSSDETDRLRAGLEKESHEALYESALTAVREVLKANDVPTAAFIDDHVMNAIVQRNQARDRVAELEKELDWAREEARKETLQEILDFFGGDDSWAKRNLHPETFKGMKKAFDVVEKRVREMLDSAPLPVDRARWIPVSERLPEQWSGDNYPSAHPVPFLYEVNADGTCAEGYGYKRDTDPDSATWVDMAWTDAFGDPKEVEGVRCWFELPPPPAQESQEEQQ